MRRDKFDEARRSPKRLRRSSVDDFEIEATLAYVQHTTQYSLEKAEIANATLVELFQESNLRWVEIVSLIYIHSFALDGRLTSCIQNYVVWTA